MILMGYSGAQGTLIYEKNLKSKISCQTPFNLLEEIDQSFESQAPKWTYYYLLYSTYKVSRSQIHKLLIFRLLKSPVQLSLFL
jgi:hypothetical protein